MHLPDIARYGLAAGIAATANANRRAYHMRTTWLPHLALNSVALLLPDLLRPVLAQRSVADAKATTLLDLAVATLTELVCKNPAYVAYVAPLAAGYLLSHPDFNIYKGAWGELAIAGFGLDALPHAATAFALVRLSVDAANAAAEHADLRNPLADLLRWCQTHEALFSAAVLALATVVWELAEYRVYRHELAQRGDPALINMQWSLDDTAADVLANLIGWAVAMSGTCAKNAFPVQHG